MKSKILHFLKQTNDIVSGEELSSQLKVSRVTVWKHIKALQEMGYTIISGPKGYSYSADNDFLFPWEFAERQSQIHYFDALPSTMNKAKELAREGAPDQSVVLADFQEKGRGRMQRIWLSQRGGLYFTLILRPQLPATSAFLMNFITSTALAQTIRDQTGLKAEVKWPNDILIGEKKLSGMLSELEASEELVSFVNIGIGINVNNDPTKDEKNATSIALELGHDIKRRTLLSGFLDRLAVRLDNFRPEDAVSEWKKHTMTLGRQVKIVTLKETFEGKAVDIDESGALILQQEDGTVKKIIYGDCFHL
ncbi:MAG: BirA family biotin operon repressor/biotin-[acetyl-CoA-carboxylase] ligase [Desulforhopalus sp.]|jgi:BirA family biotin operon repressor/biotin-[acetyl-CoA-carboxylase] ligase